MARQMHQVIRDLRSKIASLASQRDKAVDECTGFKEEVKELKLRLEERERELVAVRMEVDFLTVSHRLADSPENLISARRRLQRLIAKIDRCVALLKDDADIS
ncbi:MAG: hypothetical protein K2K45_04390 [Muribaculaceae bacterium]|nr:hypothetical protein [Muribaculaceae bacterium]